MVNNYFLHKNPRKGNIFFVICKEWNGNLIKIYYIAFRISLFEVESESDVM